ncbi:MAG: hypothetical protein ACRCZJ_06555 [Erysipelotrichaceae bacterium]
MIIKKSNEMTAFMDRCNRHLQHDHNGAFLGRSVTAKNEKSVQAAMKKAGFPEFAGEPDTWPSLLLDTKAFQETPYQKNIRLDQIQSNGFRFVRETMQANTLFNADCLRPDPNRELQDWMVLRALDAPYEATVLLQDDEVWMLDVPSEANTIDPFAAKAQGDVLCFGLGIGYFIYMAALNPKVTSITVVEKSKEVIAMFQQDILPQFPAGLKLNIIEGDAFAYFNQATLSNYDYTFVDIWRSNDDGFEMIQALLEQYLPPFTTTDFWIEPNCMELLSGVVFLYFQNMYYQKKQTHPDPYINALLKKCVRYFDEIRGLVDDVTLIKDYMYHPEGLREILATK